MSIFEKRTLQPVHQAKSLFSPVKETISLYELQHLTTSVPPDRKQRIGGKPDYFNIKFPTRIEAQEFLDTKINPYSHFADSSIKKWSDSYGAIFRNVNYVNPLKFGYTLQVQQNPKDFIRYFKYMYSAGINKPETVPEVYYQYFREDVASLSLISGFQALDVVRIEDVNKLKHFLSNLLDLKSWLLAELQHPVRITLPLYKWDQIIDDTRSFRIIEQGDTRKVFLPEKVKQRLTAIINEELAIVEAQIYKLGARRVQLDTKEPLVRTPEQDDPMKNLFLVYNPMASAGSGKPVYTNVAYSPALQATPYTKNVTSDFIPLKAYEKAPAVIYGMQRTVETPGGYVSTEEAGIPGMMPKKNNTLWWILGGGAVATAIVASQYL